MQRSTSAAQVVTLAEMLVQSGAGSTWLPPASFCARKMRAADRHPSLGFRAHCLRHVLIMAGTLVTGVTRTRAKHAEQPLRLMCQESKSTVRRKAWRRESVKIGE